MRPFPDPLAVATGPDGDGRAAPALARLAGPVTYQGDPQTVLASESLAQALRQIAAYGRDGLPVLSGDGQQVQGWITGASVLDTVAREIGGASPQAAAAGIRPDGESSRQEPPNPLPGLPGPRGHHRGRLTGLRPGTGRHHLATRHLPGLRPAQPHGCRTPSPASTWPPATAWACSPGPQPPATTRPHDRPDSDQGGQRPRVPGTH